MCVCVCMYVCVCVCVCVLLSVMYGAHLGGGNKSAPGMSVNTPPSMLSSPSRKDLPSAKEKKHQQPM